MATVYRVMFNDKVFLVMISLPICHPGFSRSVFRRIHQWTMAESDVYEDEEHDAISSDVHERLR